METALQQPAIAPAKSLEGLLKTFLQSYQRIAAGSMFRPMLVSSQQVLGHSGDNRPRKKVRSQHGKHDCFSERHEEVPSHARQQEHRSKHDADRKRGNKGWSRDLRCAIQNNFIQIFSCSGSRVPLIFFTSTVAFFSKIANCKA